MFSDWTATDGFLDVKSSVPWSSNDRGYTQQDLSSIGKQREKIQRMMRDGVAPLWLKPTTDLNFFDPISTPWFMFQNWLNGEWVGGTSPKYSDEKYDKIGIPFTFVILEGISLWKENMGSCSYGWRQKGLTEEMLRTHI